MTTPCTGRFTDEELDVVQFNVRLVVNVIQVVPFMQELCSEKPHKFRGFDGKQPEQNFVHNQISVLESSVGPLDKESPVHELYRYGDLPVVELDLLCEYVFDKTPEFEAIKPIGPHFEYRDYGYVQSLQETLRESAYSCSR